MRRDWPWWRYRLFAVDASDDLGGPSFPELAEAFNEEPRMYFFRRSAKNGARFYEQVLGLPLRFYVIPIARHPTDMED